MLSKIFTHGQVQFLVFMSTLGVIIIASVVLAVAIARYTLTPVALCGEYEDHVVCTCTNTPPSDLQTLDSFVINK